MADFQVTVTMGNDRPMNVQIFAEIYRDAVCILTTAVHEERQHGTNWL